MQTKWVKEMQKLLWALIPSLSTAGTIHRRSGAILLWARVQQPRISISTTGGRLERGGALVIFPFPLFFNFQLVCSYVYVVFSVFI
jgi:alanine-alpha-ketoisovalerate/valine-pyruvate aminotransferase